MGWDPNQAQNPNQPPNQYGGYNPNPPPTDPYSGPQSGYQGGYQQPSGEQPGGYQQPGYQQPGYQQPPYGQPQQQYGYQQPYGAAPTGGPSPFGPSTMSIDPKTAAGLSYLGVWITGLIFFLLEKRNAFVRFHAMQSILFFGGLTVLNIILRVASSFSPDFLALGLGCLSVLVGLASLIGWIVLMINAFQGKYFKLPVVGDYAERYANQGIPTMM